MSGQEAARTGENVLIADDLFAGAGGWDVAGLRRELLMIEKAQVVKTLTTHEFMPCSQTSPTVRRWWAQCEGCDWKGPDRASVRLPYYDHRDHLADALIAAAASPASNEEACRCADVCCERLGTCCFCGRLRRVLPPAQSGDDR